MNAPEHGQLYEALCLILPLVLAIVCHEVAHGLVARALGDTTAHDAGRLTLNPLRHVDPLGTLIVPGLLALAHLPVFGWAKPVPVNMWRLRNPRRDMMLVAAAGPASNFVMALMAAVMLGLVLRFADGWYYHLPAPAAIVARSLGYFIQITLSLALFNLIPIPPFDGSHIVEGLLPDGLARGYAKVRRYGMLVPILLIVVLPMVLHIDIVSGLIGPPFDWVLRHYLALADGITKL